MRIVPIPLYGAFQPMERQMTEREFNAGRKAFFDGLSREANPFICGTTKLGAPKFSDFDLGSEWDAGFQSCRTRSATKAEIEAATRATDLGQFRKRFRRVR